MALIKSANSTTMLKRAVVLDIGDLGQQAARVLSEAREEAQRIVQAAREEERRLIADAEQRGFAQGHEKGLAEGHETGRQEGHSQGLAEANDQLAQLMERWTAALNQWESDRAELVHSAREDVLIFALEVARKVVHRVVQTDPAVVRDQVERALRAVIAPGTLTIAVNPQDKTLVEEALPAILETISRCEHAQIREDASVERGGCVLTTARGRIDATIQTQIDRIVKALIPDTVAASNSRDDAAASAAIVEEPPQS